MIPPKAPKACERCGVTYIPASKRQKYCKECVTIVRKESKKAYEKARKKRLAYKKMGADHSIKEPTLTIAQAVKESRTLGMSYGKYIAWRCS